MKISISLILFLNFIFVVHAQTSQFGTNNYIEYQKGNLPIVISVPHGGSLEPGTIPDRTCNSPVFAVDENTEEVALEISSALHKITGCYPHVIYNHLNRAKLDANRNLADGACTNSSAKTAWNEFHDFINTAQIEANNAFGNNTLYIDLHGHGNPIQRIELGYLLYDDELALPDASLNTAKYIGYSTIQNLAKTNANNYTHAQLLRGENAFGSLLNTGSYPSVPSATIQFPGTTSNYFSGGYNIANHTSYKVGNVANGFQMELNYAGIRDTPQNRKRFADTVAKVMLKYLQVHL